jgi:hypothetical protein
MPSILGMHETSTDPGDVAHHMMSDSSPSTVLPDGP